MKPALDAAVVQALSPAARSALEIEADSAFDRLRVNGGGSAEAQQRLEAIKPAGVFGWFADEELSAVALAGLWLWHDFLDEAHEIVGPMRSPTAAFFHAIIHRREGDLSNAKYWYRQCENHPALPAIAARCGPTVANLPADKQIFRIVNQSWNGSAFVDLVGDVTSRQKHSHEDVARMLQKIEWMTLFELTARQAVEL